MRLYRTLLLSLLTLGGALAPAALAAADQNLLYIFRAPKDRDGFRTLTARIEVHDINDNHRLIRTIPLPSNVKNIRGVTGNAATKRIHIAHYGVFAGGHEGHVLCLDMVTNKVVWQREYSSDVDRGAITPDGSKLFMPSGEGVPTPYFYVIDAVNGAEDPSDRITVAGKTHNTITSLDGKLVFMSAFGVNNDYNWLHVANAATNQPIRRIGPCAGTVRPFTINGKATLAFINTNTLLGFQVGEVATGKILFTAKPPASYPQPPAGTNYTICHGISLTGDEKQCYVVDQTSRSGIHVFDVSGLPTKAPVWKKFIDTHGGREKNSAGNFIYGEVGIYGQPGWIISTMSGRYQYPETGEIIDSTTNTIVGQLKDKNGLFTHSRFGFEVVMRNGVPIRVGDQFGVGRVTGAAVNTPPTVSLTVPSGAKTAPSDIAVTAAASDSDGTIAKVEFFVNGVLRRTELGAPYTFAWNDVAAGTYSLTAKATDDDGASSASTTISVVVKAAPVNVPPTVALTVPGGSKIAPADIALSATVTDSDGSIAKVEFLIGGVVRHTETVAPYTYAWNDVPAGTYQVTAKAYDDDNAVTTTAITSVTVSAAPKPPTILLTVPGGTLVAPADLAFSATASDSDGTIAKVEFLVGGVLRHTEIGAPYTWAWNDAAAGTYSVTAKATDSQGLSTTTPAKTVTVQPAGTTANPPPTVALVVPTGTHTAPASLTLTATASDNVSVAKVEFLIGGVVRVSDTTAPYAFAWNTVPAGTYQVAARATDNQGATTTTDELTVTISAGGSGTPLNQDPTISLDVPSGTLLAPADLVVTAQASDSDGTVAQVQFFLDGEVVQTEASAPYVWTWNDAPAGSYLLNARVTDNHGATTWSVPVAITIDPASGPALVPPTVTLVVPSGSLIAPADLRFVASATDSDGTIAQVDFYVDGVLLHSETLPPYEFPWNDVAVGSYVLTAKATDNDNALATSDPVLVTVSAPGGSAGGGGSSSSGGGCGLGSGLGALLLSGAGLWFLRRQDGGRKT